MEQTIGTRITLEVVEQDNGYCRGCYFNNENSIMRCRDNRACKKEERTDGKDIIYKEVKEDSICGK